MYIRHGDLIFESITEKVSGKKTSKTRFILARGEFTGHQHVINSPSPMVLIGQEDREDDIRYLKVNAPAKLTHQEHKTLGIPKGFYKIYKEREYSYFDEEIKLQRD